MSEHPRSARRFRLIPIWLFLVAVAIRAVVIVAFSTDGLYGQDPFAYYDQAEAIADGLLQGRWAPPESLWPNGFPALAALAMMLLGRTAAAVQALNVLLGSLLVVVIYLLTREVASAVGESAAAARVAGSVAAGATAVAGQLVFASVVIMSDMAALLWLALAAWLLLRFLLHGERWPAVVAAGAVGGLAVITRWASALAAPGFALAVLSAAGVTTRRRWSMLAAAAVAGMAVVATQVPWTDLGGGLGGFFVNWSPVNAVARSFAGDQGRLTYLLPNALFYAAPLWHPGLLLPTLGGFALPGIVVLWRRRRSLLILLATWALVPWLFFAGLPVQGLRFCLTLWVPVVVVTALGVVSVGRSPARRRVVAALVALSLAGSVGWSLLRWPGLFAGQAAVRSLARDLAERLPENAVVLAFEATLALEHYTGADVRELYTLDAAELEACLAGGRPVWVVVDPGSIARQWSDSAPARHLARLASTDGFEPVMERTPWVVYAVHAALPGSER